MFANSIKVSPVLEELGSNATSFKSYFPKGSWVSLTDYGNIVHSDGEWIELPANVSRVQSHIKPGSIIALQNNIVD